MAQPFTLLIKPAGPDCNIDCKYCFYTRKSDYFGQGRHRMSDETLEKLISDYLGLHFPASSFAWQGGEPTLMGLDFYKKAVELQQKYGQDNQVVTNALQTNSVLLDEKWCKFLQKYKFLVGVSIDGPKRLHDFYRIDKGGNGTYDRVIAALNRCKDFNVEFNTLTLLNSLTVQYPEEIFDFLVDQGVQYLQFIQCVEQDPQSGEITEFSITAQQYGEFLCRVFDRWCNYGPTKVSVRTFDSLISFCLGHGHTECTFMSRCTDYIVVEHSGDVFCCDFFVEESCKLGNIMDTPIDQLAGSPEKIAFAKRKRRIANQCCVCRFLDVCRGGCMKDRIAGGGMDYNVSYFCEGYKMFFEHALPKLRELAATLTTSER